MAIYRNTKTGGIYPVFGAVADYYSTQQGYELVSDPPVPTSYLGPTGTLAQRPTPALGSRYFATDDNGGTEYRSTGVAWIKVAPGVTELGGQELASAVVTVATPAVALQSATDTALSGASLSFTSDGSPVWVEVDGCLFGDTLTASTFFVTKVWDGAVTTGTELLRAVDSMPTGTSLRSLRKASRWLPAPGAHTLVVSLATATSQKGSFSASQATQLTLKVTRA